MCRVHTVAHKTIAPSMSGNLIKLVINIHIWMQIFSLGLKYTDWGVNISEMCSLEA